MPNKIVLTGQRFTRLIVGQEVRSGGSVRWECTCDCGSVLVVKSQSLKEGWVKSCGCLRREMGVKRFKTHGGSEKPEYWVRVQMIQRCTNPKDKKYKRYGLRGIKVCNRWLESFENFIQDMGDRPSKRHSIERVDNDGNYEKSNCIWATSKTQARNTRRNIFITHDGRTATLAEWSEKSGIKSGALLGRMARGDTGEKLFRPLEKRMA